MTLKSLAWLLGFVIVASLGCAWYFSQKLEVKKTSFRVAILTTTHDAALDAAEKAFVAVLNKEFKKNISFIKKSQENSMTQGQLIAQQFENDKNINLVFSLGTNASIAAYSKINSTPLIMGAVGNPKIVNILQDDDSTCCFSDGIDLDKHIDLLKNITPAIKRVGIIFSFKESYARFFASSMHYRLKAAEFEVVDIPITDFTKIPQLIDHYKNTFDLLWAPADNGIAKIIAPLAKALKKINKPFISCDPTLLDYGPIASLGIDYTELGTRAGYAAAAILRKERIPLDYGLKNYQTSHLVINKKRCQELNLSITTKKPGEKE